MIPAVFEPDLPLISDPPLIPKSNRRNNRVSVLHPRLDRDVAIKVLPERLARDPQALARFEREAKSVAALSHPNILAIHDFGSDNGVTYAVTELLEGETLRDRLNRSPLGWRKAAETGIAIADGLSAAHSKGITHRDLKPEKPIHHRRRTHQDSGFRSRAEYGGLRSTEDGSGDDNRRRSDPGDGRTYVAGAGARHGGGCAQRYFLAGLRAV